MAVGIKQKKNVNEIVKKVYMEIKTSLIVIVYILHKDYYIIHGFFYMICSFH